jgi:hypothetical protein
MRRACLVMLVAVGCGTDTTRSCLLDDVLARAEGAIVPMDCGRLPADATDAQRIAAHDCVLAAEHEGRAFVVQWQLPADSHVERAFLALTGGNGLEIRAFRYDGSPGGSGVDNDPHTNTTTCVSINDLGDCGGDRPQSLCLACGGEAPLATCP